jgi:hypothetical protein
MPRAMVVRADELDEASNILADQRVKQPDYWHYYDSEVLLAAAAQNPFFTNVAGKTFYQTNLRQTPLPRPQIFTIQAIGLMIDGDVNATGDAVDNLLFSTISLLEDSRFEFTVGNKIALECQIPSLPGGGGAYFTGDQDVTAALNITAGLTNGPPSPAYMIEIPWKITIVHGEAFEVRIEHGHVLDIGGFPAGTRLFCVLEGILDRGVIG